MSAPKETRAWRAHRRGKPADVLKLDTIPVPTDLKPGELLVNIKSAALNPAGYKVMGLLPDFIAHRPYVVESDFAGVVVESKDARFKPGDEVYGVVPFASQFGGHQGALSPYIRVPAVNVDLKPANITMLEAGGLAVVGMTAYQALFNLGHLEPGQSVFINGGSTSVGIFAIQLAKSLGCKVTASASGKNEQFLKDLGVDEFIDYTKGPVQLTLEKNPPSPKFHLILEAVGILDPALYTHSEAYLAPNGVFISVGPQPKGFDVVGISRLLWKVFLQPTWLGGTKRSWKLITVNPTREHLKHVSDSISEGKVKPVTDSVYEFEDVLQAYERMMSSRATGKILIKVDPSVE